MADNKSISEKALEQSHPVASDYLLRQWNELQGRHEANGFTVIEFEPMNESEAYWRCHVVDEKGRRKNKVKNYLRKRQEEYDEVNESLKKIFRNERFKTPDAYLRVLEKRMAIGGCYMPVTELQCLKMNRLELYTSFLKLKQKYFSFQAYLSDVYKAMQLKRNADRGLPAIAALVHFRAYVNFLIKFTRDDTETFVKLKTLWDEPLPVKGFEDLLPSEQLVNLLYYSSHQSYLDDEKQGRLKRMIERSVPVVKGFFKSCEEFLDDCYFMGFEDYSRLGESKIRDAFYTVFETDHAIMKVQALLDDVTGLKLVSHLSEDIQYLIESKTKASVANKLKAAMGGLSIMDRIHSVSDSMQISPQPHFSPASKGLIKDPNKAWYHFDEKERTQIVQAIDSQLDEGQREKLNFEANSLWNQPMQALLNGLTMPFYRWNIEENNLVPQLNLLRAEEAYTLQEVYWEKRKLEKRELELLNKKMTELRKIKSLHGIHDFIYGVRFEVEYVQDKWLADSNAYQEAVRNNNEYRIRRMREFGILEEGEAFSGKKNVWLDEMLQIEEEVKPYILYVKEAFQSALPVRRTVEFDPYRHSHDGLEFDPATIQDQDKWMRGDIMKTLRRKVGRGEVEQVNAFCMDASGSMDHERMRSLFKIIYLLVLGLEDRKSYDCFHFIKTYFWEAVNFTSEYTNRALLYNLLTQISKVKKDRVVYGGSGGTNISEGVDECHTRIVKFADKIREEKPDMDIACSLFVVTDGEPSMGIVDTDDLSQFIQSKREDREVAIKGIYIKPEDDESDYMPVVFGEDNCIEADSFEDAVHQFVHILTQTYIAQRKKFKRERKLKRQEKHKRI